MSEPYEGEPVPEPTEKEIRLTSIRKRIATLREFLESTLPVLSVGVSGAGGSMSASIDRKGAIEELKALEREERNILRPDRRFRAVDMSGDW